MRRISALLLLAALAALAAAVPAASARPDRFDAARAWAFLRYQVSLGPRPAGSAPSRALAARLKALVPAARYQAVPGGLRNVIGRVPGRDPKRVIVLGAHYDTFAAPGFVGANDGASGVAVLVELARELKPRRLRATIVLAFFDGEEAPPGTTAEEFLARGVRGSTAAAPTLPNARAMILLDMIGDRSLRIPREANSDPALWRKLRAAAARAGAAAAFPDATTGGILDDHIPFARRGVPSVDAIDFDFPCWHRQCDDLTAVSPRSLDALGETLRALLPTL